jgi:uncharacterized protein YeaO (DUF488 family)
MAEARVRIKRVYDPQARSDGRRFLVERLWPRGVSKQGLHMAGWCREAAPSHELRKWFNHDPRKWAEFQRRYRNELEARPEAWQPLIEAAQQGAVTLLFSSRDQEHNNAVVLKDFLEQRLA